MLRFASVAVGAVLIAACAPTKPNPYPRIGVPMLHGEPDLSGVEIDLARGLCFGLCPVYTLRIE